MRASLLHLYIRLRPGTDLQSSGSQEVEGLSLEGAFWSGA